MKQTAFKTVASFLDVVDREKFQNELGYSTQVVTRAKADNIMPAHWFVPVRDWCADRGVDAPEHLFKWSRKSPLPTEKRRNDSAPVQGVAE